MKRLVFGLAVLLCACEPPFIDQCKQECACTSDSFACQPPRSGGCDNSWRREWTLASRDGCESQYLAWFDCVHAASVCSGTSSKSYGAPAGACETQASTLRACCSVGKCEG